MPSCDVKNELQNRSKEEIHGRHMKSRFKKGSQNDILLNGTHCEHIYFIYKKLSFFLNFKLYIINDYDLKGISFRDMI